MDLFWRRIERFPPILCRLLARHRYCAPLTTEELSKSSGLAPVLIEALSHSLTWHGTDLYLFRAFTRACGIDFTDRTTMKRVESYLGLDRQKPRRPTFRYLKASPHWDSYYKPLFTKWLNHQ